MTCRFFSNTRMNCLVAKFEFMFPPRNFRSPKLATDLVPKKRCPCQVKTQKHEKNGKGMAYGQRRSYGKVPDYHVLVKRHLQPNILDRKTVAIQTRSMIGERNNRSLVGNNGSPAENNGSYSTWGPCNENRGLEEVLY